MRVTYTSPSVAEFALLLNVGVKGGGLSDIRIYSPRPLRGSGLFSLLAGLARSAAPIIMRSILPEGLNFAQSVLGDVNNGQSFSSSLRKRGMQSLATVGRKIVRGGGGKRVNKTKKKRRASGEVKRKRKRRTVMRIADKRYNDVFAGM